MTAAAVRVRGKAHVVSLRIAFSPLALVAFMYVPVVLLYAVSDEGVFTIEFDSRKTMSLSGMAFFTLALLAFAAGAKMGDDDARARVRRVRRGTGLTRSQRRGLTVVVEAALALSVVAYAIWFARGFARAGGFIELFEIWRAEPYRVKTELMPTLPGVTTLTQLAVAAIPLAVAFKLAPRGSLVRALVVVVLVLATSRAVLLNERLALLELVVPLLFLVLAPRKVTIPRIAVYAGAFVLAALAFFAATELRRTYVYTDDFSATRATTRFFGYYLTSVNNGIAVVDEYPARTPVYSTGAFLWEFPVVGELRAEDLPAVGTLSLRYADAFDVEPRFFWPEAFRAQGLDYEFNVFTAPGFLAADLGWAALAALLLLGILSGALYARSESRPFAAALYAVWLVGLLEFMRILYFTNTRVFPAYLVFVAAYLVLRRPQRRARPTPVALAPPERSQR